MQAATEDKNNAAEHEEQWEYAEEPLSSDFCRVQSAEPKRYQLFIFVDTLINNIAPKI